MFIPPQTHELSATFLYFNGSSLGLCYLKGIFFTSNVPRVPRNSKSTDQFSSVQFFVFLSICESDYIDRYFCSLFLSKLLMIEITPQNFFFFFTVASFPKLYTQVLNINRTKLSGQYLLLIF